MLLGLLVAAALIVGLQLPLLHPLSTAKVNLVQLTATNVTTPLAWPQIGSAALDIPSLGVLESYNNKVVPIASLTKMMTAYVALKKRPLGIGETGPCLDVTSEDVTTYDEMSDLDESSVVVVEGEQLCESDLLNGLLVHSAGNYAVMLANMVAGSMTTFIADMNQDARTLGLRGTFYADVTGFSPDSVSTALDQAKLATLIMKSPLIRSIVLQPSVTLPVAGVVSSFTPFVGVDNVIGVKSGRTAEAGGCDVMAMTFQDGSATRVVYAVVLGQEGGDLLGPAGDAALALANSAVASRLHYTFEARRAIGELGWDGQHVAFGLTQRREVWWWPAQTNVRATVSLRRFTSTIHRGEVVGHLKVRGVSRHTFTLRALGNLSPPTLLQRLR
jgi:D-alanyl-D-alanine carboxypeptidase (penicillin-binding protein 5/6)